MVKEVIGKVERVQYALAERRIPDLLAYGLSLFAAILGLTMLLGPDPYEDVVNFRAAFGLARVEAWGTAFIVTGLLLGLGFWRDRKSGQYAAVVMTALFAVFGFLSSHAPAAGEPGGIWSGPLVYTFVAYVSAVCVIACSADPHRRP